VEGRPLDERELIERARGGSVVAYEELVRAYQELAFRVACLIGGSDEAEDAVQDGFMKAYRALPRFRSGSPFRPWLLRIVTNEARNRRRAAGRRAHLVVRAIEDRPAGDAVPSPEEAVLAHERHLALADAVSSLRDDDRLVVTCRYLLQLSEAETAATLDIPAGTVKSRLSRALARLRIELRDEAEPSAMEGVR
jgi:RNA polymerase sigma factor (sigma-70 family)